MGHPPPPHVRQIALNRQPAFVFFLFFLFLCLSYGGGIPGVPGP
jgi:hypothetical protein